MRDYVIVI